MKPVRHLPGLVSAFVFVAATGQLSQPAREPPATLTASSPRLAHAEAPLPVLTIVATEYRFEAPDSFPSGVMTVRLLNHGKVAHQAKFVRLEQGKTLSDLRAALEVRREPPSWAVFAGGVQSVGPGQVSEVTLDLTPGRYAMFCHLSDSTGSHLAKGMIRALTVTAARGGATAMPAADVTVRLMEYGFILSGPVTPGRHRILVRNVGTQWHEMLVARLAAGRTLQDALAFLEKRESRPPGRIVGGMPELSPGQQAELSLDFQPGEYILVCTRADAKDGRAHFKHGMIMEFEVK